MQKSEETFFYSIVLQILTTNILQHNILLLELLVYKKVCAF